MGPYTMLLAIHSMMNVSFSMGVKRVRRKSLQDIVYQQRVCVCVLYVNLTLLPPFWGEGGLAIQQDRTGVCMHVLNS